MKREMFTTATVEAAFNGLREYGVILPTNMAEVAKNKKTDVIIGKFAPVLNCFDGYCISETPKEVIKILKREYPNKDIRIFKYSIIVCQGCKNDNELLKSFGIID